MTIEEQVQSLTLALRAEYGRKYNVPVEVVNIIPVGTPQQMEDNMKLLAGKLGTLPKEPAEGDGVSEPSLVKDYSKGRFRVPGGR